MNAGCRPVFNEWGFDFIKIDYCGAGQQLELDEQERYTEIVRAIREVCPRNISLNICRWLIRDLVRNLARSWRISPDIAPNWAAVKRCIDMNLYLSAYAGGGHYNDMDMLVVGMHGASNDGFIGSKIGGCTDQEYLTHFALWAIMGSPLIMGCDLRKASEETKKTLLNRDLIAINQDLEARGAYVIKPLPDVYNENEAFILVKPLADGDLAIGIF